MYRGNLSLSCSLWTCSNLLSYSSGTQHQGEDHFCVFRVYFIHSAMSYLALGGLFSTTAHVSDLMRFTLIKALRYCSNMDGQKDRQASRKTDKHRCRISPKLSSFAKRITVV